MSRWSRSPGHGFAVRRWIILMNNGVHEKATTHLVELAVERPDILHPALCLDKVDHLGEDGGPTGPQTQPLREGEA